MENFIDRNTLPALTGSDKQITWAYEIRTRLISDLESFLRYKFKKCQDEAWDTDKFQFMHTLNLEALQLIASTTEARWWIDHKSHGMQTLLANAILGVIHEGAAECLSIRIAN